MFGFGVLFELLKMEVPELKNAVLPNFLYFSGTFPVKSLKEMLRNLRLSSGGKSEGKVPFIEFFDKSKWFNE